MKKFVGQSLLLKRKSLLLFASFSFTVFSLILPQTIAAQSNMSNSQYIIRLPNLNSFSGSSSNSGYKLGITGGQTAPGLYSGTNYKVQAGFQYVRGALPFSFAIDSTFIDFGPITPGAPVIRTTNLTVSHGSSYGYSVIASENHALKAMPSGATIPDTTCDGGTCTETTASTWTTLTTFGFGYRCDNVRGSDCPLAFSNASYFKQFASTESAELAQPVMSSGGTGSIVRSKITYKVNISTSQTAGQYQNSINYIAIPSI